MVVMNAMSNIRKDFVASSLRLQLNRLCSLLDSFQNEEKVDCDDAYDSLKDIENNLRKIRKLCVDNII